MRKKCIVSYAVKGREDYPKALWRMIKSVLDNSTDVDVLYYCDEEFPTDFLTTTEDIYKWSFRVHRIASGETPPDHSKNPYAFKPWVISKALMLGYEEIIWFDSTIFVHKKLDDVFRSIRLGGIVSSENLGYPVMNWISDSSLEKMGVPKELWNSQSLKQITACWIGFDFSNKTVQRAYHRWNALSMDGVTFLGEGGSSRSGFVSHRHDQAVLSIIMNEEGFLFLPYGSIFCYYDVIKNYGNSIIFTNRGLYQ